MALLEELKGSQSSGAERDRETEVSEVTQGWISRASWAMEESFWV